MRMKRLITNARSQFFATISLGHRRAPTFSLEIAGIGPAHEASHPAGSVGPARSALRAEIRTEKSTASRAIRLSLRDLRATPA